MPEPQVVVFNEKRIDYETAAAFQDQLLAVLGDGTPTLILDFSGVEAISSVGLRGLVVAAKRSHAAAGTIVVAALQPLVREIFAISRFDTLFRLFDTVDEARTALADT
jgi:anti-anti-sigma factor